MAANLNIYASYFYANRVSHGYGWGFIRPGISTQVSMLFDDQTTETPPSGRVEYRSNGSYIEAVPSIPDNSLGWEVNVGVDWALLEACRLSITGAYWNPGKWFNYACIDKGVRDWDFPTAENLWGTNPNRKIAPIYGTEVAWSISF
jgi:hypothetical protein